MQFRPNWIAFFLAFSIGIVVVYLSTPPPQIVYKFPTPYNAGKVVYRDAMDTCYKFKVDKVTCPDDKNLIREQPQPLAPTVPS